MKTKRQSIILSDLWIYAIKKLPLGSQRRIIRSISKKEGGEWISKTTRKWYIKVFSNEVGMGSYGCFFNPNFGRNIKIGNYCSIAQGVQIFNGNHPLKECVMHPIFYSKIFGGQVEDIQRSKLDIGNDVWIGSNAIILPNCKTIGNGAVIGAGSVVTKDVLPYSIVVGNPAKEIGTRFSKEERSSLESSKWWEMRPKDLLLFYNNRNNPSEFCEAIQKHKDEKRSE